MKSNIEIDKTSIALIGVEAATKILKIPFPEVFFASSSNFPNPEISSIYRHKNNEIIFNEDWLNRSNELEIMITALHETRHAYQKFCIDTRSREDIKTIEAWEKEFNQYKQPSGKNTPTDDSSYLKQEIEIDAVAFAYQQMKELFDVEVKIPEEIKVINMSDFLSTLRHKANGKNYKDIFTIFYEFFIDIANNTIDQMIEVLDFGGYQLYDTPFAPSSNLKNNPVRDAFMAAEKYLNEALECSIIDRFDEAYKTKFMRMVNQIISIQPKLSKYPTKLMIAFKDNIDWLIQDKEYFCNKELETIIKERIDKLYPKCFEMNSKYREYYNGSIGEIFWRMIAVGVDVPIEFVELVVDSSGESSTDRSLIEPMSDYLRTKEVYKFCEEKENQHISSFFVKLDNIDDGLKLKISVQY